MDRDWFESFPGPVAFVDSRGGIEKVNDWACNYWGLSRAEVLARNITEMIGAEEFLKVVKEGKAYIKRHTYRWNDRSCEMILFVLPDPEQEGKLYLAFVRAPEEQGLLEQLEATRLFVDHFLHAKIGLLVVDEKGHYLHANDIILEILNATRDDELGRLLDISRSQYRPLVLEAMVKKKVLKEIRPLLFGERERHFDITAIPIIKGKRVIGGLSFVMDVTEKVLLEKKLIDSERMSLVGEMAARIMHDIRNPLQVVKSSVQIMGMWNEKGAMDYDKTRAMLANVDIAVNSVIELINDLLQFSKPSTDKMEVVNLMDVLERMAVMMSSTFNKYQIDCTLDVSDNCEIWGNRKLIRQAVLNIIQNAIEVLQDYAGNRQLVIRCCEGADKVFLEIYNAGPVIDEKIIGKIFDTFFSTKGTKGTGLGLAITKEIVETLKGRITCISTLENKGTSFLMEFPRVIADMEKASQIG